MVEVEVQMALLVVTDTISIDLVVDVMVSMVPKIEVMVVLQTICMELAQTTPHLQSEKRCRCD